MLSESNEDVVSLRVVDCEIPHPCGNLCWDSKGVNCEIPHQERERNITYKGVETSLQELQTMLTASKYCLVWVFLFGLPFKVFKTRKLRRGFHTLIKSVSFSSPTDVRSHTLPNICILKS